MRFAPIVVAAVTVIACGTSGEASDAGADATFDAGACCVRGAPTTGNCGPVAPGGWANAGACKQKEMFDGRQVKPGVDDHGCAIWVDDGPCTYEGGAGCSSPRDITGYSPTIMSPPHTSKGACTSQDIDAFANCEASTPGACQPDASACGACLLSQTSDAKWGPLVQNGASFAWNSGGCIDLVLGQTALEPQSCGQLVSDLDGCEAYACNCPPQSPDLESCKEQSALGVCQSYANATSKSPCPASQDDAGAVLASCFPDLAITDPTARQRDFVTRIATYFCGP